MLQTLKIWPWWAHIRIAIVLLGVAAFRQFSHGAPAFGGAIPAFAAICFAGLAVYVRRSQPSEDPPADDPSEQA